MTAIADLAFWRGRRVLLTGHTGFKGTWAALWLSRAGAHVTGLALPPSDDPAFFDLVKAGSAVDHRIADLREPAAVTKVVREARPEIVLHMAAQSLVRRAFREPVQTIATNTLGTVHLLDAIRSAEGLRAVLVVTTDKVYENTESGRRFVETDALGGSEPYGASKAAADILTRALGKSYFEPRGIAVATARGGNVLGGGDFGEDRLVPDVVRAAIEGKRPMLRNPASTRPWQHVLDCLAGYFTYIEALASGRDVPRALNFGPSGMELPVQAVAEAMLSALDAPAAWEHDGEAGPREAVQLALDSGEARRVLRWGNRLTSAEAIEWTATWHKAHRQGRDMRTFSLGQIEAYEALA